MRASAPNVGHPGAMRVADSASDGSIAPCAFRRARSTRALRRARSSLQSPYYFMIKISSAFDAGAIELVDSASHENIRLNIRSDSHSEFRQWFYFRMQGGAGQACRILLENAGACTYVDGWRDYQAVASYDHRHWFRVPTSFDGASPGDHSSSGARLGLLRVFRALFVGAASRSRRTGGSVAAGARARSRQQRRGPRHERRLGGRRPARKSARCG